MEFTLNVGLFIPTDHCQSMKYCIASKALRKKFHFKKNNYFSKVVIYCFWLSGFNSNRSYTEIGQNNSISANRYYSVILMISETLLIIFCTWVAIRFSFNIDILRADQHACGQQLSTSHDTEDNYDCYKLATLKAKNRNRVNKNWSGIKSPALSRAPFGDHVVQWHNGIIKIWTYWVPWLRPFLVSFIS